MASVESPKASIAMKSHNTPPKDVINNASDTLTFRIEALTKRMTELNTEALIPAAKAYEATASTPSVGGTYVLLGKDDNRILYPSGDLVEVRQADNVSTNDFWIVVEGPLGTFALRNVAANTFMGTNETIFIRAEGKKAAENERFYFVEQPKGGYVLGSVWKGEIRPLTLDFESKTIIRSEDSSKGRVWEFRKVIK